MATKAKVPEPVQDRQRLERIKQQMEADYLPGSATGSTPEEQPQTISPAEYSAYQLGQIRKDINRIADALAVAVARMGTKA